MKKIDFGVELLRPVNGEIVAQFFAECISRGFETCSIKEVQITNKDALNECTIIRFMAGHKNGWETNENVNRIRQFPYLYIVHHAKSMSCASYHVKDITKASINELQAIDK